MSVEFPSSNPEESKAEEVEKDDEEDDDGWDNFEGF